MICKTLCVWEITIRLLLLHNHRVMKFIDYKNLQKKKMKGGEKMDYFYLQMNVKRLYYTVSNTCGDSVLLLMMLLDYIWGKMTHFFLD